MIVDTSRTTTPPHKDNSRVFDLLVQPVVGGAESLAIDDAWRAAITAAPTIQRPLLRIYEIAGNVLSIGRYHVASRPSSTGGVHMNRRHSGGRRVPFGAGFLGLSMVLPHRSALVADDPYVLSPPQVLNRCVRGILTGLKSSGIPAFYPGRDCVTIDRRVVAMISFDVSADGGTLFEAVLARSADFATRGGQSLKTSPPPAHLETHEVTSLSREFGVEPSHTEVAKMLVKGYEAAFGISFVEHDARPPALEHEIRRRIERFESHHWLTSRHPGPSLDHHGNSATLLGSFAAYYSLKPDGRLDEILLAGDIIANSAAIEELERGLRNCPVERAAIDAVVAGVFSQPQNFVLGLPRLSLIAETICGALRK